MEESDRPTERESPFRRGDRPSFVRLSRNPVGVPLAPKPLSSMALAFRQGWAHAAKGHQIKGDGRGGGSWGKFWFLSARFACRSLCTCECPGSWRLPPTFALPAGPLSRH